MSRLFRECAHFIKERVRRVGITASRFYLQHIPIDSGKRKAWNSWIRPKLSWVVLDFDVKTVFGSRIRGNTKDLIQRYIYYFGVWEPHLTRWISGALAEGDGFIDIGANIGYYSLLAVSLVGPSGCVTAIEASPTIFGHLKENLRLNGASQVRTENIAVAAHSGRVPIYRASGDNEGRTTTIAEEAQSEDGFVLECEVEAAPLVALLSDDEVCKARIIKIDVEGAEFSVAEGMASLLPRLRKGAEIVLEVSPERLQRQGKSVEDLLKIFYDAGYFAYGLVNDYSERDYLPPQEVIHPKRIRHGIDAQTDVIFSRFDAEELTRRCTECRAGVSLRQSAGSR